MANLLYIAYFQENEAI